MTGKERIPDIGPDVEALEEALGLERLKFALVLDAGERLGRRLVVGGLEDAAEQDRHIFELGAGALFDRRNRLVAEESVRTAEIEHELRSWCSRRSPWLCDGWLYDYYHSTSHGSRLRVQAAVAGMNGIRKLDDMVADIGGPAGDQPREAPPVVGEQRAEASSKFGRLPAIADMK